MVRENCVFFFIPKSSLNDLVKYLSEKHYSNAILGFTLSFGSFSCEVRATSEYFYSLCEDSKNV